MTTLCVYCSSSTAIEQRHVRLAAEVGTALAARGWALVTGGGNVSMMGAIARAARAGGARTTGVIPALLSETEVADSGADELVVVPDMRTRKAEMDRRADAFLALAGGLGTLEELLEVWTARTLAMHDKPVVVCDPFGVYAPLREMVAGLLNQGFVRPSAAAAVTWTGSVGEALASCAELLAARGNPEPTPTPR